MPASPGEPCQARIAAARTAKVLAARGLQGLSSSSTSALVGDRLTVGQRTLTPPVLVRIQVPQPHCFAYERSELAKLVSPRKRGPMTSAPSLSRRETSHRPRAKPVAQVPLEFMGRPMPHPPPGWKPPAQPQFDAPCQCGILLVAPARDHDRSRRSGMFLEPFWAGPAHVVQLGPITIRQISHSLCPLDGWSEPVFTSRVRPRDCKCLYPPSQADSSLD